MTEGGGNDGVFRGHGVLFLRGHGIFGWYTFLSANVILANAGTHCGCKAAGLGILLAG
jgi:hypothetical protein